MARLALVLALALAGCGRSAPAGCLTDIECGGGRACVDHRCLDTCSDDSDCDAGFACRVDLCRPAPPESEVLLGPVTDHSCIAEISSAGTSGACALEVDGTVWCWGDNSVHQLARDGLANSSTPLEIPLPLPAIDIGVGEVVACAVLGDRTVRCWGKNRDMQLGDGSTAEYIEPVEIVGLTGADRVESGELHSCALTVTGGVFCWGNNDLAALGTGDTAPVAGVVEVALPGAAQDISVCDMVSCAVVGGDVYCWGTNEDGALGIGEIDVTLRSGPVGLPALDDIREVTGGAHGHTCAVGTGGQAWCWGNNSWGQVGNDSDVNQHQPALVQGLGSIEMVGMSAWTTCALAANSVYCWGHNQFEQIGDGTVTSRWTATIPYPGLVPVDQVAVLSGAVCALSHDEEIWCWGANAQGQLGPAATLNPSPPVRVPLACD